MVVKILLWVIIVFVLLSLNIAILIIITTSERKKILKKIRNNLGYFSPKKLSLKMSSYVNSVAKTKRILELSDKISALELNDYKKIEKIIKKMDSLTNPSSIFKINGFNSLLKKILPIISKYEEDYLDARFSLYELTSDIEVEKTMINKLEDKVLLLRSKIEDSNLTKIKDSPLIYKKFHETLNQLKLLSENTQLKSGRISQKFQDGVNFVDMKIKEMLYEISFVSQSTQYLNKDIKETLLIIKRKYNDNIKNLHSISNYVIKNLKNIEILKKEILRLCDELEIDDAKKILTKLDILVLKTYNLVNLNIECFNFNKKYAKKPYELLEYIDENYGLFVSEIKRHKLMNEQTRLLAVDKIFNEFKNIFNSYDLNYISKEKIIPSNLHKSLISVIFKYEEYVQIVNDNIEDVSKINKTTNKISSDIAMMNTHLLQIEYNINSFQGVSLREKMENEKNILQGQVSEIRKFIIKNAKINDLRIQDKILKLIMEINDLMNRSKGISFEANFIENTIMFLNRYRGDNIGFNNMLDSIKESYKNDDYSESLRKSKELIEIYGIK